MGTDMSQLMFVKKGYRWEDRLLGDCNILTAGTRRRREKHPYTG
jgi:hypothetical protein